MTTEVRRNWIFSALSVPPGDTRGPDFINISLTTEHGWKVVNELLASLRLGLTPHLILHGKLQEHARFEVKINEDQPEKPPTRSFPHEGF